MTSVDPYLVMRGTYYTRPEEWLADLLEKGNTRSDIAAGICNGDIDRPEWLCRSEDTDHIKIWDAEEGCAQVSLYV